MTSLTSNYSIIILALILLISAWTNGGPLKARSSFVRTNPMSDVISATNFHHLEFYCHDATNVYKRFMIGLGMDLVAKSDQSTGNAVLASYTLRSNDMTMIFTAPYSVVNTTQLSTTDKGASGIDTSHQSSSSSSQSQIPFPNYCSIHAKDFVIQHGIGIKSIAIRVDNVYESYSSMIKGGAEPRVIPHTISDSRGYAIMAEVHLYGDVNLRLVNTDEFQGVFLPHYQDLDFSNKRRNSMDDNRQSSSILHDTSSSSSPSSTAVDNSNNIDNNENNSNKSNNNQLQSATSAVKAGVYGFTRFDHVVGNLWSLEPKMTQIKAMTGFHEFAEFVTEDVGTVDSGLNSVVLANNNEYVLLPLNEPTFGTKRKSQIQTYLEQNNGEGVQHIAMFTRDIFTTLRLMRAASYWGGFEFMDSPGPQYYQSLRVRLGDSLTEQQYSQCEELGVLADRDDEDGVLLQIFTKPVSDRATLFLEVIQRIGCSSSSSSSSSSSMQQESEPKAGCGGFGKGNFKDLFKSIEEYEKKLGV